MKSVLHDPQDPRNRLRLAKMRYNLRTPINHIVGYSEILMEELQGQVPESFHNALQRIRSGAEGLLALINQHLNHDSLDPTTDLHRLCHEFRTPVNHIIGYSELLVEQCHEVGCAEAQDDLARISDAARTWLALMEEYFFGVPRNPRPNGRPSDYAETQSFARMEESLANASPQARHLLNSPGGRLLVADDDEPNRELLSRRLEKLGYAVTACRNGVEVLEHLRQGAYDLLLLDVLMPGMDGSEVLSRVKADPAQRHLPIIMISALDQLEGIVRCIELGAEDYLAKPFNPVFLRARISAALEKKRLRDREVEHLNEIERERQRSEELLHIILPPNVAEELKSTNSVKPRRFENVGLLFCDIVGFTAYSDRHPPEEILPQLQAVVEAFEEISARHGLEKIKTIGDSFMAAVGLRNPVREPAQCSVRCGLEMISAARRLPPHWEVRVGVNVGPVIAGVVGHRKYQYDVWGDTVNTAARMEEAADPGTVCITASTWQMLKGQYACDYRGQLEIQGKGRLGVFCLAALAPALAGEPAVSAAWEL
jgi:class 3 adenylate cyclase